MLLYDVFHKNSKDFDAERPLPAKGKKGDRAVCKNGPKQTLEWDGKKWVDVDVNDKKGA